MPDGAVYVDGLDGLVRAFKRTEGALPSAVDHGLHAAGVVVADEGKQQAEAQGLHETGLLIENIYSVSRGPVAVVRDTTMRTVRANAPYSYPRRWEYGGRPFLRPALAAKTEEVEGILDRMLAELGGEWAHT